jgi:hypothetical protein
LYGVVLLYWLTRLINLDSLAFFIDEANAVALARREEKKLVNPAIQKQRVATIRERGRRNLLALARQARDLRWLRMK